MNMKKTVRKMSAILTGATMIGATVMGAMALDLSDYPSPFIQNGFFEGKIVIGEKAAPIDTIGATDIAAAMQADAVTPVGTGGTVTVAGGVTEEVALGTDLSADFASVDNSDVAALKEGVLTIDIGDESDDYDWHEEISFTADADIVTALSVNDEELADGVYLFLERDAIAYNFVFDDALADGHYIANASESEPITIEFLGKEMEIIGAPTASSIRVQVGEELYFDAGEKKTVGGKEITLVKTGNDVAVVSVDGTPYNIALDATKKVGNLRIKVKEVFNDDGVEFDSATLIVGEEASKTYATTEAFIGEDEDDAEWVWVLSGLQGASPVIGIEWNQVVDNIDDAPLTIGESLSLPNDYAKVQLVSANYGDYREYSIGADSGLELYDGAGTVTMNTDADVILFSAEGSDDAYTLGVEESKEVAAWYNTSSAAIQYFFKDDDGKFKLAAGALAIDHKDNQIGITHNGTHFVLATTDLAVLADPTPSFAYLGGGEKDATDTDDLLYNGVTIAGWEEDALTTSGILVHAYDSTTTSDEFVFEVPADETENTINVAVVGGAGSATSGGSGSYRVNPIPTGSTILDKDAMSLLGTDTPLIVVGGPSVNTVAAELMGNPTREQINQLFTAGTGKIKFYAAQNALLVAGYEGQDTLGAAYVLKDYADYNLDGTEVEVVVPSLSSITVRTPQ